MINKMFELTHDIGGWAFLEILQEQGIPCHKGTIFTVKGVERKPVQDKLFVTDIEVNGVRHQINHNYAGFFEVSLVESMVNCGIMREVNLNKVVHGNAGVVGVSRCDLIVKKPLEQRYNEWVIENIHVYNLFCKFTLQAIESGKKKISHWLIVNRLRWEMEIETKGLCEEDKEYKISNDYIAFLARDFIKDYPEHESIFNLKQMKRV